MINLSVIVNCWKKAGINLYECLEDCPETTSNIKTTLLNETEFNEYVRIDDDADLFGPMPSDAELCGLNNKIEMLVIDNDDDDDDNDAICDEFDNITSYDVKSYIDKIRSYFANHGVSDLSNLNALENQVDEIIFSNYKQKKISDFFKN